MTNQPSLEIRSDAVGEISVSLTAKHLFRYIYEPETPLNESPKPYFYPVSTLAGRTLTNLRPNDHPWHHALAMTLTGVDGTNFWGGPTWSPGDGYIMRENHGVQRHVDWVRQECDTHGVTLEHSLAWEKPGQRPMLQERRTIQVPQAGTSDSWWTLCWKSEFTNTAGRDLKLTHYHAEGLEGSHYSGLLFRGARDLLANHADPDVGIVGPNDSTEEKLHGAPADWMACRCSHDGFPADRSTLVFVDRTSPRGHWFVRPELPAVGFTFHYPSARILSKDESMILEYSIVFADGLPDPANLASLTRQL